MYVHIHTDLWDERTDISKYNDPLKKAWYVHANVFELLVKGKEELIH